MNYLITGAIWLGAGGVATLVAFREAQELNSPGDHCHRRHCFISCCLCMAHCSPSKSAERSRRLVTPFIQLSCAGHPGVH